MFNHFQQPGIGTEKILPKIRAALDKIFLILAVGDFAHALDQEAVTIRLNKFIPIAAPDHLDDVPSGTAEDRFQFLNDLAVSAHRPIAPLQVAVNHKNKIVETLSQ